MYIRDEDENDVDGSEQQLWRQQQRWHDVDDGDEISRGARRSTANVATRSRRVDARTLVESIRHGEPRRRTAFGSIRYITLDHYYKIPFLSLSLFRSLVSALPLAASLLFYSLISIPLEIPPIVQRPRTIPSKSELVDVQLQ